MSIAPFHTPANSPGSTGSAPTLEVTIKSSRSAMKLRPFSNTPSPFLHSFFIGMCDESRPGDGGRPESSPQ